MFGGALDEKWNFKADLEAAGTTDCQMMDGAILFCFFVF